MTRAGNIVTAEHQPKVDSKTPTNLVGEEKLVLGGYFALSSKEAKQPIQKTLKYKGETQTFEVSGTGKYGRAQQTDRPLMWYLLMTVADCIKETGSTNIDRVAFSKRKYLKAMHLPTDGPNYTRVLDSLRRLQSTRIEITYSNSETERTVAFNLLSEFISSDTKSKGSDKSMSGVVEFKLPSFFIELANQLKDGQIPLGENYAKMPPIVQRLHEILILDRSPDVFKMPLSYLHSLYDTSTTVSTFKNTLDKRLKDYAELLDYDVFYYSSDKPEKPLKKGQRPKIDSQFVVFIKRDDDELIEPPHLHDIEFWSGYDEDSEEVSTETMKGGQMEMSLA